MRWARSTSRILGAAAATLVIGAAGARAQSFGSFALPTSTHDIGVVQNGTTLTFTLGSAPTFVIGGTTYDVAFLMGVYALDGNTPSTTLAAYGSDAYGGSWTYVPNHQPGDDVGGWSNDNKDNVIGLNESKTFTFSSINLASITDFGVHVSLANGQLFPGTQGNTGFIRITGGPPSQDVPEPSLAQILLASPLAGLLIARRRLARR